MAGYSGTPLSKKLGITPGCALALLGAPAGFERLLAPIPEGVRITRDTRGKRLLDVIVYFSKSGEELGRRFPQLAQKLDPRGGLWIAWPKKTSGVATDLGDVKVRDTGLAYGLVDNKVCAIDEVWSGLRFVVRVKDR